MKEPEDNRNEWKDIQCSWIGKINIDKMSILPKVIYRLSANSIKNQWHFSTELEQIILKFVWKHKDPKLPKQS